MYLTVGNYSYIGTNEHCIRGTTEEDQFLAIPELADIALKRLNHGLKNVDSYALLESTTDESIQGKAVILDSVNRFNQREVFTTFLFPLTKRTLTFLLRGSPTQEQVRRFVGGFAFVMPPDLGNNGIDGNGAAFKGLSGSHLLEPGMDGDHSIAAIFHSGIERGGVCINKTDGICTTIGFAHAPDTLRHMVDVYDVLKPRGEKLSNK